MRMILVGEDRGEKLTHCDCSVAEAEERRCDLRLRALLLVSQQGTRIVSRLLHATTSFGNRGQT
jgi:hypothetical protein